MIALTWIEDPPLIYARTLRGTYICTREHEGKVTGFLRRTRTGKPVMIHRFAPDLATAKQSCEAHFQSTLSHNQ